MHLLEASICIKGHAAPNDTLCSTFGSSAMRVSDIGLGWLKIIHYQSNSLEKFWALELDLGF